MTAPRHVVNVTVSVGPASYVEKPLGSAFLTFRIDREPDDAFLQAVGAEVSRETRHLLQRPSIQGAVTEGLADGDTN